METHFSSTYRIHKLNLCLDNYVLYKDTVWGDLSQYYSTLYFTLSWWCAWW